MTALYDGSVGAASILWFFVNHTHNPDRKIG